ncbi:MAG: ABC transporter permease [Planctomycetota bacterium]|nr:ABC transporter permease [Planctomycetota bacterium]
MSDTQPVLSVRDLALKAGGRRLFGASSFELHEGQRVLLVGPSGSGKSLFADLLLGFAGPGTPGIEVEGRIELDGTSLLGRPPEVRDARVGAVFQLQRSGLFDDLTIEQNLQFGSRDRRARDRVAEELNLDELDRRITVCSGGEGVRIAIARTLLRGAGVLVYDEPTTGLDPVNVAQVVEAIRASHRRLSLIITHDYAAFDGLVDVILFLDPVERRIRTLEPGPESMELLHAALAAGSPPEREAEARRPGLLSRLASGWHGLAVGTTNVLQDWLALLTTPSALLRLAHPLDGPRMRQALRRDVAPGVLVFVGLSAMLVALTGTYFLFERLPKRVWTEPIIQDDLVTGLGLIYVRVALPLMVSVLLAAKLGASAAAQLGHMSLTRQLDALELLRVPRRRHLLLPTAAGQLVSSWISTGVAVVLAYVTSLTVFLVTHPGYSVTYFREAFVKELDGEIVLWVLAKTAVSAVGVAAVAYRIGTQPKREPEEVIRGIHRTLLRALLLVLAVHAVFAFLEF